MDKSFSGIKRQSYKIQMMCPMRGQFPCRFSLSARQVQRQLRETELGFRSVHTERKTEKETQRGREVVGRQGEREGGREGRRARESEREGYSHFASRNNGHLENNGYRQSLGLFISATVSPRQEELEVCPVRTAPTGPDLGGR